jgi:phosphoribosylanthranilate isomerase
MNRPIQPHPTSIKICGITRVEDAQWLAKLDIQAVGFNFFPRSSRYLQPAKAKELAPIFPPSIERVGIFVDGQADEILAIAHDVGLTTIQCHGQESVDAIKQLANKPWIKAFRMKGNGSIPSIDAWVRESQEQVSVPFRILIDAFHPTEEGGTGQAWDWRQLGSWRPKVPWFLAGGLNPQNVGEAIDLLCPDGVDVASGVESAPGIKDRRKVEDLINQVRRHDRST